MSGRECALRMIDGHERWLPLADEAATEALGARLARALPPVDRPLPFKTRAERFVAELVAQYQKLKVLWARLGIGGARSW